MAPIRIGFIGLSKPTDGMPVAGAWAQLSHLPAIFKLKDSYQITALCNSSIDTKGNVVESVVPTTPDHILFKAS